MATKNVEDSSNTKPKEYVRDEIFTRFDKMLGVDQYIWNILVFGIDMIGMTYIFYLLFTFQHPWSEALIFETIYGYMGGLGVTIGAHRYWTHKTFKANIPLQIILAIWHTMAFQYPLHKWCLDHRLHHKYLDTDADPHNVKRGFWYSQLTWLFQPKTKIHEEKLKEFDMSDLEKDPVVRFQSRWYWTLALIFHFWIPMYIVHILWELSWTICFICCLFRHGITLHITGTVNSVAHMFGYRPYDKSKSAVESKFVSLIALGEGWHNYHHTFPWDYKASEFGWKINLSTMIIDFFAYIGWAWDLKTVSQTTFEERIRRTGQGKRREALIEKMNKAQTGQLENEPQYWGWNDDSIPTEWKKLTTVILHEKKTRINNKFA